MARGEPCGNDHTGELISPTGKPQERVGQLIDKYGHVHSEAVLRNGHPPRSKRSAFTALQVASDGRPRSHQNADLHCFAAAR